MCILLVAFFCICMCYKFYKRQERLQHREQRKAMMKCMGDHHKELLKNKKEAKAEEEKKEREEKEAEATARGEVYVPESSALNGSTY